MDLFRIPRITLPPSALPLISLSQILAVTTVHEATSPHSLGPVVLALQKKRLRFPFLATFDPLQTLFIVCNLHFLFPLELGKEAVEADWVW